VSATDPLVPRPERLDVYLSGTLVGQLEDRTLGFVALRFSPEAVEQFGAGARVLSVGLPVSDVVVDPLDATPFFAGLLPEGEARTRIAEEFRLSPSDTFGLLQAIGRECAGALTIVPQGVRPGVPGKGEVRWLEEAELADVLRRLGDVPLGVTVDDDTIRLSLAGVQDKLPAVVDDDAVGLPEHGFPSTHILKPGSSRRDREGRLRFPDLVENEAYCLALAGRLGVPTSVFRMLRVQGEAVLAVERFDRHRRGGLVERIHQEDACQALGVPPESKYEAGGGPGLRAVADVIRNASAQPAADRLSLFDRTVVNCLIGNAEAHAKNFAFLHEPDGVRLAPAYDLVSTAAYAHTDRLAMRVGGVERIRDLDRDGVLQSGTDLALPASISGRRLDALLAHLGPALEATLAVARADGWYVERLDRIASDIRTRARRFEP